MVEEITAQQALETRAEEFKDYGVIPEDVYGEERNDSAVLEDYPRDLDFF